MKKIQVSTIRKEANVQVIELNTSFVAKAVSARINAEIAGEEMLIKSEDGKFIKQVFLSADSARRVVEEVLPFLQELVDALEEKEED